MTRNRVSIFLACALLLGACSSTSDGSAASSSADSAPTSEQVADGSASDAAAADGADGADGGDAKDGDASDGGDGESGNEAEQPVLGPVDFGDPPLVPEGPLGPELRADLDVVIEQLGDRVDTSHIEAVTAHGDARVAWFYTDLLRFTRSGELHTAVAEGFNELTGASVNTDRAWKEATNHLLAWDLPAFDSYVTYKAPIFLLVEPKWEQFFIDGGPDRESAIDWRILSWGGVLIDDRPLGDSLPCSRGCIPALDDPVTTDAARGAWYDDDSIVVGIEINGEARAYQKNMMEVHEMVNDTLGGRRIGIPYCTLCGSAQAYLTDSVPSGVEVPVLRTSGLLSWSNKVMYDLNTQSVFDTFTGQAVTGPLFDAGITLDQVTVVTSTWGDWKAAYPDTTILRIDGGVGNEYAEDPLRGRDDNGPIFPVGEVDDRYQPHDPVIGVLKADGSAVGFVVAALRAELADGESLELDGVRVVADGGGFVATDLDGNALVAHQAFWFSWLQFYPEGTIWEG